jgi:hypothetical protein
MNALCVSASRRNHRPEPNQDAGGTDMGGPSLGLLTVLPTKNQNIHEVLEGCEVLQGSTLADLSSPYLNRGLREDEHEVSRVEIRNKHIRATCCLPNYYLSPTDTSFHMSLLNAGALTSQVGIIHCLRLNGYRTKPFEIWMNDFTITFVRPVRDPQRIDIEMEVFARSTTEVRGTGKPKKIFYRWRFDICHGSAWGTLSLCMPAGPLPG